ncbi:MAG: acyltransferase domain-containing protein [Comamonadaceae bacterium]|nr:acyltransferase domain-containing protein [Comamonadaceae bacterium]
MGYDLVKLCLEGPEEELRLTRHTQPALLVHSLACLEIFRELTDNRVQPILTGGHSLGEYCALVAAGALSFETALRLVQKRGECMGTYGDGEMLAFPLHLDNVRPLAEKHYCAVAACNLPDQTVVGGRGEDLDRLTEDAHVHFPRKRPTRLKTEGAFHTFYMIAAALHFRPVLDAAAMTEPTVRVLSNYTGDPPRSRSGRHQDSAVLPTVPSGQLDRQSGNRLPRRASPPSSSSAAAWAAAPRPRTSAPIWRA